MTELQELKDFYITMQRPALTTIFVQEQAEYLNLDEKAQSELLDILEKEDLVKEVFNNTLMLLSEEDLLTYLKAYKANTEFVLKMEGIAAIEAIQDKALSIQESFLLENAATLDTILKENYSRQGI